MAKRRKRRRGNPAGKISNALVEVSDLINEYVEDLDIMIRDLGIGGLTLQHKSLLTNVKALDKLVDKASAIANKIGI